MNLKYGRFEIRVAYNQTNKNAYTLFEDDVPITNLCFGTAEAAYKYFKKFMGVPEPKKFEDDTPPAKPVQSKERTVGNYSNSGYINLMGEYE